MTRFKSVLCASLLTLAMSSSAFAGNITSRSGNITSTSTSSEISGNITSRSGNITSRAIYDGLVETFLTVIGMSV